MSDTESYTESDTELDTDFNMDIDIDTRPSDYTYDTESDTDINLQPLTIDNPVELPPPDMIPYRKITINPGTKIDLGLFTACFSAAIDKSTSKLYNLTFADCTFVVGQLKEQFKSVLMYAMPLANGTLEQLDFSNTNVTELIEPLAASLPYLKSLVALDFTRTSVNNGELMQILDAFSPEDACIQDIYLTGCKQINVKCAKPIVNFIKRFRDAGKKVKVHVSKSRIKYNKRQIIKRLNDE